MRNSVGERSACGFLVVSIIRIGGLLKHHPNVTGFHDKIAFNENISVAKELFGEHVRLFTMLDTTYIDRQIRRDAKEQFKGHKVTGFIDNPELSPEEQIRLVQEEGYTRFMAIPLRNARNHSDATFMWVLNRSYRDLIGRIFFHLYDLYEISNNHLFFMCFS